jgi:hypothetical protein
MAFSTATQLLLQFLFTASQQFDLFLQQIRLGNDNRNFFYLLISLIETNQLLFECLSLMTKLFLHKLQLRIGMFAINP